MYTLQDHVNKGLGIRTMCHGMPKEWRFLFEPITTFDNVDPASWVANRRLATPVEAIGWNENGMTYICYSNAIGFTLILTELE